LPLADFIPEARARPKGGRRADREGREPVGQSRTAVAGALGACRSNRAAARDIKGGALGLVRKELQMNDTMMTRTYLKIA
jgi:hypothetical protein